jgi:hypothetical protein
MSSGNLFKLKNYNLELMSNNKIVQDGGVGIYIKKGILYRKLAEKKSPCIKSLSHFLLKFFNESNSRLNLRPEQQASKPYSK